MLRQTKERSTGDFYFLDMAEEFRGTRECENTLRVVSSCIMKKQGVGRDEAERLARFYVMFFLYSFLRNNSVE